MSILSHVPPRVDGPYRITGRSLARQLRDAASFAARDALISDVLRGKLDPVELTKKQRESVLAASLIGSPRRPLDEKKLAVRRARQADKALDQLGEDTFWDALDRRSLPLRVREAAE